MIEKKHLKEQMKQAFPEKYSIQIDNIFEENSIISEHLHDSCTSYKVSTGIVKIPYRIYIDESILSTKGLTSEEENLLLFYFLRHHNGYIREKCLDKIIEKNSISDYEIPFIIMLIGEYVNEITVKAFHFLKMIDQEKIKEIILNNNFEIKYQHARIVSYWNEYYRKKSYKSYDQIILSRWSDYIGYEIILYLKSLGYNE